MSHPLRVRILALLDERIASPVELAGWLDATLGTVAYHVRTLERMGLVELVRETRVRGAVEHHYRSTDAPAGLRRGVGRRAADRQAGRRLLQPADDRRLRPRRQRRRRLRRRQLPPHPHRAAPRRARLERPLPRLPAPARPGRPHRRGRPRSACSATPTAGETKDAALVMMLFETARLSSCARPTTCARRPAAATAPSSRCAATDRVGERRIRTRRGRSVRQMPSSPTAPDEPLAAAVLLGWRVAELYALVDDTGMPASDTLLPAHGSLEPADQLELQLRAACGDARRAGVTSEGAALDALVVLARAAPGSPAAAEAFRAQLRSCHIEVQKDLWALDEAAGKAYELGNGLSDTYGRVCRAYRRDGEEPSETWAAGLPARAHRAAQAAARRPAVAPQRRRRGGGARPARRLVRGRAGAPQDRRAAVGAARPRRRAPPDRHLAPAAGGRQGAGGLPRPPRARRAARRPARASSGGATGAGRSSSARRCSCSRWRCRT